MGNVFEEMEKKLDEDDAVTEELEELFEDLGRWIRENERPPEEDEYSPSKEELLEKYAEERRDVHEFVQVDGWKDQIPDSVVKPDEDGDWLCMGKTHEIRASPADLAVRVFIHRGTKWSEAIRLLEKMLEWLKNNPEIKKCLVADKLGGSCSDDSERA